MGKRMGPLAKPLVEKLLHEHGWETERLFESANADFRASRGEHRVSLKVKATNANSSRRGSINFGNAKGYLCQDKSVFNSSLGSIKADVIVGVSYEEHDIKSSRFVIMPVGFAEKLCRFHCDYQSSLIKLDGQTRNLGFPMYLRFEKARSNHPEHDEKIISSLREFENKWEILSEPTSKLHDETAWDFPD